MKAYKILMGKFSFPIIVILLLVQIKKVYGYADIVSLTVSSSGQSDETIVRLENQSTYNFDSNWDAYKLSNSGSAPNFYTFLNGTNYSINSIPKDFTQFDMDLDLKVAFAGSYSIFVKSLNNSYDTTLSIILEDKLTGTSLVLKDSVSYNFDASTSDLVNRFVLHYVVKSNSGASQPGLVSGVSSFVNPNSVNLSVVDGGLNISFNDPYSYSSILIISTNGMMIYKNESYSYDSNIYVPLSSVSSGKVYIVKIVIDKAIYESKIYF